jgi:hypothetical protein
VKPGDITASIETNRSMGKIEYASPKIIDGSAGALPDLAGCRLVRMTRRKLSPSCLLRTARRIALWET